MTPESRAEYVPLRSSKIRIANPVHTLTLIRQVVLFNVIGFEKATNGVICPNLLPTNYAREQQEDSCILQRQGDLFVVGHYDKKNYGISISDVSKFSVDMSANKTPTREIVKKIQDALVSKFRDQFDLNEDSSGAVTITTSHGFTLAFNSLKLGRLSSPIDEFRERTIGSFEFAVSTAKIKEKTQYGSERISDFQDDRIIPVTTDNIQQYFDDVTLVYDEARKVFEDFGINLSAIEAEIISRPKKEPTIADDIRSRLGDVSENFVIKDPNVRFNDVIGHKDILTELINVINALKDPQAKQKLLYLPSGILLHGTPGCGKTYLAEAVATESGCKFLYIQPSMLFDSPVAKDIVRALFEEIKGEEKPTMIFVDEADTFFRRREPSDPRAEVVSAFLTQLSGIGRNNKAFLVLASNRPDLIDSAMRRPGRIDLALEVKPPTSGDRMELFRYFTSRVGEINQNRYDPKFFDSSIFVGTEGITLLASRTGPTNGEDSTFTQADIKAVVNSTLLKRLNTVGEPPVTLDDLLAEIDKIKDSRISPERN